MTAMIRVADGRSEEGREIARRAGTEICCPNCGAAISPADEPVLKRGAVVIAYDPIAVFWRGRHVPLSPTEARVFAHLARRGRVSNDEIDAVLVETGASPDTRSLVLGHIRRKLLRLGACDPFERLGAAGWRLRVDPDERGSLEPVIGLRMSRYARAAC